jgi:hypothetical protein
MWDGIFGSGDRKKKGTKSPSKQQQRDHAKATSGRESLNTMANRAARDAGLSKTEKQSFHRELTSRHDNSLTYPALLDMARRHKR